MERRHGSTAVSAVSAHPGDEQCGVANPCSLAVADDRLRGPDLDSAARPADQHRRRARPGDPLHRTTAATAAYDNTATGTACAEHGPQPHPGVASNPAALSHGATPVGGIDRNVAAGAVQGHPEWPPLSPVQNNFARAIRRESRGVKR